ncbi:MAG TPA: ATP-binding cassette domain-containing protein [Hyphomicrobiaceae bacterium]|nr:ATP-binding cassette domain-containing protein [Hyphomicrobiaceae bacterium]
MTALLSLRAISKRYGAVEALAGIDLDIHAGEVVAICGDNGAGKSSLIKVMSGAEAPSAGSLVLDGVVQRFASPADALARGIATIYQHLALAPRLSIAENVFMGAELTRTLLPGVAILDKRAMRASARAYLARLAISIDDMRRPVERLSGGQRQAVAIARALRWNARIVILDEPTAALGVKETAVVLGLVRKLTEEGRTVVLISHAMADVVAVASRVVILKLGSKIVDRQLGDLTAPALAEMIVAGRESVRKPG